jgi:hypothetical protein
MQTAPAHSIESTLSFHPYSLSPLRRLREYARQPFFTSGQALSFKERNAWSPGMISRNL